MSPDAHTRVGISFSRGVMRYVEVERRESGWGLVRLGSCDFEFNAERELFGSAASRKLDVMRRAVSDVFSSTGVDEVRCVVPAACTTAFRTAVEETATPSERESMLAFEASLLTGGKTGGDLYPTKGNAVGSGAPIPVHVYHVDGQISDRVGDVCSVFGDTPLHLVPSATAVYHGAWPLIETSAASCVLLLGAYDQYTEYQVIVHATRRADTVIEARDESDRIYFSLDAVRRLGMDVNSVEKVLLHGDRVDGSLMGALHDVWSGRVELANPGPVVNLEEGRLEADFGFEAFLTTVGAAVY